MNRSGFTVLELTVVVSVVSLMALVGVIVQEEMVVKARQAEAKIKLANAHKTMKTFYAENQSFTYCLKEIGAIPANPGGYYSVGVSESSETNTGCGSNRNGPCNAYSWSTDGSAIQSCTPPSGYTLAAESANGQPVDSSFYQDSVVEVQQHWFPFIGNVPYTITQAGAGFVQADTYQLFTAGVVRSKQNAASDTWSINAQGKIIRTEGGGGISGSYPEGFVNPGI